MNNCIRANDTRRLLDEETLWLRELASRAGLDEGEMFAIAVHLPGKPRPRIPVPVFDLFLGALPSQDTLVRRTYED